MSLVEKYQKVLEIIKSGISLKDDTYVSQFLESSGVLLENADTVERLGILELIKGELAESGSGCCLGGNMASKDQEDQNNWWNFIIDLSRTVVKSVPKLTFDLLKVVGVCDVSNHVNTNFIPVLQFYSQVFRCKTNILEVAKYICKENEFWEKFLQPVISEEKNKYATKATVECIAVYVKFLLEASKLNQKPKGCEIRVQLESNLKALITNSFTDKHEPNCDVFEILNNVIEILDQKSLEDFLLPIIKENINFHKLLASDTFVISSAALQCYISTFQAEPDFQTLKTHLQSIFIDSNQSLQSKKMVIVNVIKFPRLSEIFLFILDQISENSSETMFLLCEYLFSFHTIRSMINRCKDERIAQKVFNLIVKHLKQYSNELSDPSCSNTFIRNVCLFGSTFLKDHDLSHFEANLVTNATLNISKQKYEVDDFVRSGALDLLSVVLRGVNHMDKLDDIVRTLGGFVCDLGALNVVRDSALSCLSSLLLNRCLALSLSTEIIELISRVILTTSSGKDQLVKGAAVMVLTAMLENLTDQVECSQICKFFPSKDVDQLKICDIYNDEERKEMMKLASKVHEKLEDPDLLELVKTFVLTSLDVDTNWDVKVHSVQFWKAVYRKARANYHGDTEKLMKHLEKHSFFTGILMGYQDYEDSVKNSYFQFIDILDLGSMNAKGVNFLKRKVEDVSLMEPPVTKFMRTSMPSEVDGNRDDEIEDILDENDKSLVNCLTERSAVKVKQNLLPKGRKELPSYSLEDLMKFRPELVNPEKELSKETMLESVLDEIIQSSSDESQIDLVDCY